MATTSSEAPDASSHYFPPTLVQNAQIGEPLLVEEIFGPILPIVTFETIEEAVDMVNTVCHQPLALYIYTEDTNAANQVLDNTQSGGGCINTCLEHLMNNNLPFGGVGQSGYGSYHGKAGFQEFTHKRSILHQDTFLMKKAGIPPPPYENDKMYDFAVKANITGFFSATQKVIMKAGVAIGVAAMAAFAMRSSL